jgi:glycosyltransferase involved in cell wall biosynthesis
VRKVLIVSQDALLKNTHNYRISKFVQYLPDFEWEPVVLTQKDLKSLFIKEAQYDNGVRVHRALYFPLWLIPGVFQKFGLISQSTRFFVPSNEIGWTLTGVIKGVQIIRSEKIDIIFVSCPPYSLAVIGYILKLITKRPFVLDLRDGWSTDPYINYLTKFHMKLDKRIQNVVISHADGVVLVSDAMRTSLLAINNGWDEKFSIIPNGYDDIELNPEKSSDIFTITFTGSTYNCSPFRSPEIFFEAISMLLKNQKVSENELCVNIIGDNSKELTDLVDRYQLKSVVHIFPRMPQRLSLSYLSKSHALLLIERSNALTTKVFEYLATGKPIIAFINEGELADLIRNYSDNHIIITEESTEKTAEVIMTLLKAHSTSSYSSCTDKRDLFRAEYHRKNLTKHLSTLFQGVLNSEKTS